MEETQTRVATPTSTDVALFIIVCKGRYHGPFKSADQAAEWADNCIPLSDWTIAPLGNPN